MDFKRLLSQEIGKRKQQAQEERHTKRNKTDNTPQKEADSRESAINNAVEYVQDTGEGPDSQTSGVPQGEKEGTGSGTAKAPNELWNGQTLRGLDDQSKVRMAVRDTEKKEAYLAQLEREVAASRTVDVAMISDDGSREELATQIRAILKDIVREWESNVQTDTPEPQRVLYEAKRDLVELLYRLRSNSLKPNMLTSLATVLYHVQRAQFKEANESYLKLSIGNVAWPIGVKSVGIHERSASSKITGESKDKSANIMLDDKTRRWITAVKRLITYKEKSYQETLQGT
ncbi:Piso0_000845 [Millerozyma farinosa CBS 7064]|uniref:Pre-mRNA-splicing factor 18 n=1 Tax=Pichia sorbitophila (strain ATCC MYA-4447 / BCRC 22081 / CBS 7064 / NBRC 10061 / NRRL Y-12695) TaxID=559304 RepID=G8YQ80_PICSO|nr:Piso0_000845 [Millerozyma farinosa CBS 7064]